MVTKLNLDLGYLVKGEVRLFDEVTREAVYRSCELIPGGAHSQQPQSSQIE